MTEALCLLKIERDANAADDDTPILRRLKLAPALYSAAIAMMENAFGFLVGNDDKEGQTILEHVERFEEARRIIAAAHCDIEQCMRYEGIDLDKPIPVMTPTLEQTRC